MKLVDQTKFGEPGNCLGACIASILELDEIPEFTGKGWHKQFDKFLADFGLQALEIDIEQARAIWRPAGYHIISGKELCGLDHAVVGFRGKMVHDPHPDRGGLVSEDTWTVFVSLFL